MSTPTPQKIRKQRQRLLLTAILAFFLGLALSMVFICSWLAKVLVG